MNTTQKVEYLYDALGNKLAKRVDGSAAATEYYMGDVVLKGTVFGVEYLQTSEGRATKSSGLYTYEYHLKDHLGNTSVAYTVNSSGTAKVEQQADFYPFGLQINPANYHDNDNKYLYNGKELQEDLFGTVKLDWYDYGARFYDASLCRWHAMDPMCELARKWTPYQYAYNNPIRFIDPDGMLIDDYFNEFGKYKGSDNAKTDNVKIINQKDWDANKTVSEDGTESITHEDGKNNSTDFSKANMTEEGTLEVYDHYNPTDLDVVANPNENGAGGASFNVSKVNGKIKEKLTVNIEGNKKTKVADHANEIINVFSHEEKHYNDYKEAGLKGYLNMPNDRREQRAVNTQMEHSSFSGTRTYFQKSAKAYGAQHGTLYPLKPISPKVEVK